MSLLDESVWHVDAAHLLKDGSGLEDLSGNGRHALFGSGSAKPIALSYEGEAYWYEPDPKLGQGTSISITSIPLATVSVQFVVKGFLTHRTDRASQVVQYGGATDGWLVCSLSSGLIQSVTYIGSTREDIEIKASGDFSTKLWHRFTYTLETGVVLYEDSDDGITWVQVGTAVHSSQPNPLQAVCHLGGGSFAYSVLGSRYYISCTVDSVKVGEFIPRNVSADYLTVPNTGSSGGDWTIARAATGAKGAIVDKDLILCDGKQQIKTLETLPSSENITALVAVRKFGSVSDSYKDFFLDSGGFDSFQQGIQLSRESGNQIVFKISTGDYFYRAIGDTVVSDGEYVVAGTFDSEVLSCYLNGVIDGTYAQPLSSIDHSPIMIFGYSPTSTIDGEFISAAVFDRALTDEEVVEASRLLLLPYIQPNRMLLTIDGNEQTSFAIYDVRISAGRNDIYSQPDASTLDLDFLGFAAAGNVGDEVLLTDNYGQLFRGWITDVKAELQENMEWRSSITAVGPLAILGQTLAGYEAYPIESDSQRIRRIVDETPMSSYLLIDTSVEGYDLAPRLGEVEPLSAAELAREAADSGLGVFWEAPFDYDTPLRYTQQKYRTWDEYAPSWGEVESTWAALNDEMTWEQFDSRNLDIVNQPPALALNPRTVYADLVFQQTIDDVARTVKVSYGDPMAEVPPTPVIAGSGQAPTEQFSTILNEQGDAINYAETMLNRMKAPSWRLTSIRLELTLMPEAQRVVIREALQVGTRLTIPIPHGSPVGTEWQGFLEGWKQDIVQDEGSYSYVIDMTVSDRFLTEPADRWFDISAALSWEEINDSVRWMDTADIPAPILEKA